MNIDNKNMDVCKEIEDFDNIFEPKLTFSDELKNKLDGYIDISSGWEFIACCARRIIICDRELDLDLALEIIEKSMDKFEKLSQHEINNFEYIRYLNSCALIYYRCGNYSQALKYLNKALEMSNEVKVLIPDLKSNIIRTRFEFDNQVLSETSDISEVQMWEIKSEEYIREYCEEIKLYEKLDVSKLSTNLILYIQGMASLYHNLAETYKSIFNSINTIIEKNKDKKLPAEKLLTYDQEKIMRKKRDNYLLKAKKANEISLNYGKEKDVYRELQSKNALITIYDKYNKINSTTKYNETIDAYEKDILSGNWKRGRQMVYQKKIQNLDKQIEVQNIIDKDDFNLDLSFNDKIGLLYNYESLKSFLVKNEKKNIELFDRKGKKIDLLHIAYRKIDIAEKLRNIFTFLLYRRQVSRLIRDDIFLISKKLLDENKIDEVIELNENYNCRSLYEMAELSNQGKLIPRDDQINKIDVLKNELFNQMQLQAKEESEKRIKEGLPLSKKLSTSLSTKSNLSCFNLVSAYDEILKSAEISIDCEFQNQELIKNLKIRLKKIPSTLIVKFLIIENRNKHYVQIFFITKDEEIHMETFDNELNILDDIKNEIKKFDDEIENKINQNLKLLMGKLNNSINFSKFIKDHHIKNIFFIPDGELFKFPLHILNEEGDDLRKNYNVYYSPSITYLLKKTKEKPKQKNARYLWLSSPYNNYNNLCSEKPHLSTLPLDFKNNNNILLECKDANLDKFNSYTKNNEYTHLCISTHCSYNDNIITAYATAIILHNSLITPYDFIIREHKFNNLINVFIGACSGGLCKYTNENEVIGLVTFLLSQNIKSVVAPIWTISELTHNIFIKSVEENLDYNKDEIWDLSRLVKSADQYDNLFISQFIQYTDLEAVEKEN
ncbi:MAG: CHAT domain-containing protein [Methanosarcina sp.]